MLFAEIFCLVARSVCSSWWWWSTSSLPGGWFYSFASVDAMLWKTPKWKGRNWYPREWWDGTRSPHATELQVLGRLSSAKKHLPPLAWGSFSLQIPWEWSYGLRGHHSYRLPSYTIKMLRASRPCSGAEKWPSPFPSHGCWYPRNIFFCQFSTCRWLGSVFVTSEKSPAPACPRVVGYCVGESW